MYLDPFYANRGPVSVKIIGEKTAGSSLYTSRFEGSGYFLRTGSSDFLVDMVTGQATGAVLNRTVPVINGMVTTLLYADLNEEGYPEDIATARALSTGNYSANNRAFACVYAFGKVISGKTVLDKHMTTCYAVDTRKLDLGTFATAIRNWDSADKGDSYRIDINSEMSVEEPEDYTYQVIVWSTSPMVTCTVKDDKGNQRSLYYPFLFQGCRTTAGFFPVGVRNTTAGEGWTCRIYQTGSVGENTGYITGQDGIEFVDQFFISGFTNSRESTNYTDLMLLDRYASVANIIKLREEFVPEYEFDDRVESLIETQIEPLKAEVKAEVESDISGIIPDEIRRFTDGKFIAI